MEKLSKFLQEAGAKSGLYFLYVCAQIFVLASLLLTTTGIAVHLVWMILTITFYFATALQDPGVYIAAAEPNHEDANISKPQIKITKEKSVEKKWQSQKNCGGEEDGKDNYKNSKKIKQNRQKSFQMVVEKDLRGEQKKPSVFRTLQQSEANKNGQPSEEQKNESDLQVENKKQKTNEILHKAMVMLGNFPLFKSKKQIEAKFQQEQPKINRKELNQSKNNDNIEKIQIPVSVNENQMSKFTCKQQGINSMIGHQDFAQLQIHSNMSPQIQLRKQKQLNRHSQPKTIVQRVSQIKRYCRICQIYQPLRVRHCHTCDKCMSTFDHHCPWMANCIAQKNKVYFIIYLILQTLQLFTIMVDLIRFLSVNVVQNSASVGILLTAVILIFVLMVILLCFHLYLICKNLTTWQLLRWDKIEYLSIFDKTKLTSPFDKGVKKNLKCFWKMSTSVDFWDWKVQLTEELQSHVIRKKRHTKTQIEGLESDRRPFKSQKMVRN